MPLKSEFSTLKEAYCARHKCKPEAFAAKIFWRTLHRHAIPFAVLIGGRSNPRFFHDLECINTLGEARSLDDLNRGLDELVGLQEVDRSRLRRFLSVRVSVLRLRWLLEPYLVLVKPIQEPVEVPVRPAPRPQHQHQQQLETAPGSVIVPAPQRPSEGGMQSMRQVMRIHAAVVVGTPIEEVLESEGLTVRDLEDRLSTAAQLRPEASWLLGYIRDREELARLRAIANPPDRFRAV